MRIKINLSSLILVFLAFCNSCSGLPSVPELDPAIKTSVEKLNDQTIRILFDPPLVISPQGTYWWIKTVPLKEELDIGITWSDGSTGRAILKSGTFENVLGLFPQPGVLALDVPSKLAHGLVQSWGIKDYGQFMPEVHHAMLVKGDVDQGLIGGEGDLLVSFPSSSPGTSHTLELVNQVKKYRWTIAGASTGRTIPIPSQDGLPWIGLNMTGENPVLPAYRYQDRPIFPNPLLADFSSMLAWEPKYWRTRIFEVFAWTLFPDIKIMAFADYRSQSRYLGRLAYFLEKRGQTGKILTEAEIRGKHDWNAHNYAPQGLASFYNTAHAQGITLRPEELELRQFAVGWGLLLKEGEIYKPGKGGVLSFSFDPSSWFGLRKLLLGHESLHGLFYMVPELESKTTELWEGLSDISRQFLLSYFAYKGYEPSDQYLMKNEFQAYILQQGETELTSLIRSQWLSRVEGREPDQKTSYRKNIGLITNEYLYARRELSSLIFNQIGLMVPELSEITFVP